MARRSLTPQLPLPAPQGCLSRPTARGGLLDRRNGLQTIAGRTARQRRPWSIPPCCSSTALAEWGGRVTHRHTSLLRSMVGDRSRVHATTKLRRGGACQSDTGAVPHSGISVRRDTAPRYGGGTGRCQRLRAAPPQRRRAACPAQRRGGQAADDLKIVPTHCGGAHPGVNDAV